MVRKIPRGKGYDKAATLGHLKKMVRGGVFVTEYVKANGLKLDTFMLALWTYVPESFGALPCPVIQDDPRLVTESCVQCKGPYWPSKAGTKFCSSYCGNLYRKDQVYFGGRRAETVGLAESVCQLCGRHVPKGLSSHHIYGKSNDPDNGYLLALCRGCHQIVSDLALKTWCGDTEKLQKLIVLAYTQRHGAECLRAKQENGAQVQVGVVFGVHVTP